MPLDTRIALGAQPLQLENQLAQYGQAVGIQNAMQQNQLGQMQMSAAQRAMQEEEGLKNYLARADLSTAEGQRGVMQFGAKGQALLKSFVDQAKDKAQTDLYGAQAREIKYKAEAQKLDKALNEISNFPDAASALASIDTQVAQKMISPEQGTQLKTQINAAPDFATWQRRTLTGMLAAKDRLEAMSEDARIKSLPPLPGAVPTGTVNATTAALAVPGAQPVAEGVQVRPVAAAGNLAPVALNNLAPAAGNVNAMAAPTGNEATLQAVNAERKTLMDRLDVLERMRPSPGRDDEIKRREARLKEISAPINMRADGTTIIPGAGTLTAAAVPSDILRLQREEADLRAAGKTKEADVIADQIKVKNQQRDDRTASQKEQAVLDDPRATETQKTNARLQLSKLNHIPEKAMSDFERGLAASNLPETEKSKLRNAWLKSHSEHAPPTHISLTQNAEKSYGTAFGGKIADLDVAKYDAAGRAPELAANANRVLSILNQGDVFVGPAATIKLNLARVLNAAGASNDEKIANTETLISGLGRNTLGMIKGSGLGTAQGFTDKDLQFLERVAGGSIDYNAQTLRTLTDLSHKAATASAETWNKRVKEIPASALGGTGISVEPIVVPARVTKAAAATRPAGVPAEWTLHTDANGKKAYVSPDGKSFKEVP